MKRIILCYDGTLGEYNEIKTNVLKYYSLLENTEEQLTFYDPGVGTLNGIFGTIFGWGIKNNIRDGYIFLMENYQIGDEIHIIGFSRGAYTARALAGLIGEFGVLKNDLYNLIPYLQKIYYSNKDNMKIKSGFRESFSIQNSENSVKSLYLFDTVKAMFSLDRFEIECPKVENTFQAIARDEYRLFYKPKFFNRGINERWFRGSHSDIGGGYTDSKLSNITLEWMIKESQNLGISFIPHTLETDESSPIHNSYTFPFNLIPKYYRKQK